MSRAEIERLAHELVRLTIEETSNPNVAATAVALRDVSHLRTNSKLFASYVADAVRKEVFKDAVAVDEPGVIGAVGRVCKQADFSAPWFRYWLKQIHATPVLHRKLWETAYVIQCLWEQGCLKPGKKGLGFAVGREPLPSLFVRHGVEVVATDLSPVDPRSQAWNATNQHASQIETIWRRDIIGGDDFKRQCTFEYADMNEIPSKYDGRFDFCWSVCAFEHLGSIEKGLSFLRNAMKTLKPGGISVHTTEYNLQDQETIDNWATVLYQKKHFASLAALLKAEGSTLLDIDFDPGSEFFDSYVDVPPFPHNTGSGIVVPEPPHIKLSVDGFPTTSIAIIAKKNV